MVADQPIDRIGFVLALADRRVTRGALQTHIGHLVLGGRHLEALARIFFRFGDLLAGQLAAGDRVLALDALGHVLVGDALHFQRMQAAEIGDLLKGQSGIVHQPDGGGLGHQGLVFDGHDNLSR